jgi:hypothetical protein
MELDRLQRDVRVLKVYAVVATSFLLGGLFLASTHAQTQRQKFTEIDVERINVVEPDGRVRLVLANSQRQAASVVEGRTIAPGRSRAAGMIFFNEEGDEVGGLIFSGHKQDGAARAAGSLTFDQYRQDQTVALQYGEEGGQRRAGLAVIDRPETSLAAIADLLEKRQATSSADRAAVDREIVARGGLSATRMFVGKDPDGNATLVLSDSQGRKRLLLSVDRQGSPKIQFLDAAGKTLREIRP